MDVPARKTCLPMTLETPCPFPRPARVELLSRQSPGPASRCLCSSFFSFPVRRSPFTVCSGALGWHLGRRPGASCRRRPRRLPPGPPPWRPARGHARLARTGILSGRSREPSVSPPTGTSPHSFTILRAAAPFVRRRPLRETPRLLPITAGPSPGTDKRLPETVRLPSETLRLLSETAQLPSETVQLLSETVRLPSETVRLPSETVQLPSETVQLPSETVQVLSETVRPLSETIQLPSETVQVPSETVRLLSETAQIPSETVRPLSETVQPPRAARLPGPPARARRGTSRITDSEIEAGRRLRPWP